MEKILVIPDIHGRDFWKRVKNFKGRIIFLGDYHDPYFFEFDPEGPNQDYYDGELVKYRIKQGNFHEQSVQNFAEILEFAKQNSDRVTLLAGNHDWHYLYDGFNATRYDRERADRMQKMLQEANLKRYVAVENTLFTHAGLSKKWVKSVTSEDTNYAEAIDNADIYQMFHVSRYRGGYNFASSPLWQDYHEVDEWDPLYTDDIIKFQIFSHTQLGTDKDIKWVDNGACIDSRAIFEVDPENPKETLKVWEDVENS